MFLDDIQYPNFIDPPILVSQPIVDRASKPQVGKGSLSSDNLSTLKNQTPPFVNSGGDSKIIPASSERTNSTERPGVDRSSKAIAMQTYEERSRVASELLNAKKRLKDLELESQSETNREWEIMRLSKEKEAEEERVQLLQDREEELLRDISKLEEKHRNKVNSFEVACK